MTECVITGVVLYDIENDVSYNGDLFEMPIGEGVYICNCNEASAHTPDENFKETPGLKWVQPYLGAWNRRGVWVWPVEATHHSIAALEYMAK